MVAFLILHYKATAETIECIESIRALTEPGTPPYIMVVDNASNNGSYEVLAERYRDASDVCVVTTGTGLGFSGGNHFGYRQLLDRRDEIEFLVVCNNDIVFEQADLLQRLRQSYTKRPFDVLGPDIYKKVGSKVEKTSPMPRFMTKERYIRFMYHLHTYRVANRSQTTTVTFGGALRAKLHGEKVSLRQAYRSYYPSFASFVRYNLQQYAAKLYHSAQRWYDPPRSPALLQGACLIYSQAYLQTHETLFEPETFFYYEEILLYLRAQSEGLRLVYDPALKVWHKEQRATGTDRTGSEKYYFTQENYSKAEAIVLDTFAAMRNAHQELKP